MGLVAHGPRRGTLAVITRKTKANKAAEVRVTVRAMLSGGQLPPDGLLALLEPPAGHAAQAELLALLLPLTWHIGLGSNKPHKVACRLMAHLASDLATKAANKTAANKRGQL